MKWVIFFVTISIPVSLCGQALFAPAIEVEAEVDREVVIQPQFVLPIETIDQWIYGSGRTANQGEQRIKSQLDLRINVVDQICHLSDSQKSKLRLAAKGDVSRFLEKVELVRDKFKSLPDDQNKINTIYQEVQPLQQQIAKGIFAKGSLFEKVLLGVVTDEQAEAYQRIEDERRRFALRAKIEWSVAILGDAVPFSDEQRSALVKLAVDELKPPPAHLDPNLHFSYVVFKLSKVPRAKLEAILDAKQIQKLSPQFENVRGMEQMFEREPKNGPVMGAVLLPVPAAAADPVDVPAVP